MPTFSELIAHDRTPKEIAETIGADGIIYSDLRDLRQAILKDSDIESVEDSCFSGHYIAGVAETHPPAQDQLELLAA